MPWFGLSNRDDSSSSSDDDDQDYSYRYDSSDDDLEQGGSYSKENTTDSPLTASMDSSRSSEEGAAVTRTADDSDNDDEESDIPTLSFRPLQPCDRQRIQELHEQWFPVTYNNEFYDDLVNHHRLASSGDHLFTCVATLPNDKPSRQPSQQPKSSIIRRPKDEIYCQSTTEYGNGSVPSIIRQHQQHPKQPFQQMENNNNNEPHEIIVGCVVGTFVHPSRLNAQTQQLLVPTPQVHSKLFYIMTLGTVEELRGYGIATQLVEKCMEQVENDPTVGALYLHVIPYNTAAIRFYEKLGFYQVCSIDNYYNINNEHHDCFLYAKYYHGNRGHRTLYKLVSGAFSSLWNHIRAPLSMFSS